MLKLDDWYRNYKGRLLAVACQKGYSYEEAKDVVHQFFLDLLQKFQDTKESVTETVRNPEAFLLTSFKRKLIDLYRKNKNAPVVVEEDRLSPSALEIMEELEGNKEQVEKIFTAYKKLPARYKRIIYLKFYRGLSTEQIVEATGFTHQTVYNCLSKGIHLLRLELQNKKPLSKLASIVMSIF